jgi:predicted transcriptional regulator
MLLIMEKETDRLDTAALRELAEACTCTHMRKAARLITQFYDTFLQPSGLRMTQFIVLMVVALSEQETVMQMAEKLAMDRSALARSLKSLEDQGLLIVEPGSDGYPSYLLKVHHCARIPGRCSGEGRNSLRPYKSPGRTESSLGVPIEYSFKMWYVYSRTISLAL